MNDPFPRKAHELKCWPDPFDAVKSGQKRHEVRRNDRGFEVGHLLHLRKFNPDCDGCWAKAHPEEACP